MSLIESTGTAILDPLVTLWNSFALALPRLVAAVAVLIVGYIVAASFGFLVHKFLERAKLDDHVKKSGIAHSIGFISISSLAGSLLKWYIFALFLAPVAGDILKLGVLSRMLEDLASWIPDLILGIIILLVGLIIADYISDKMLHAKRKGVRLASSLVRIFLIFFVVLTALDQVGVDVSFATNTTLIIAAGLAIGLGIALGLGFGLALKDEAKGVIKDLKKGFQ